MSTPYDNLVARAIDEQTKSIKEQTRAMKACTIHLINNLPDSPAYGHAYPGVKIEKINKTIDEIKKSEEEK